QSERREEYQIWKLMRQRCLNPEISKTSSRLFPVGVSGARPRFRDVLRLPFAFGRGELIKLLLTHRGIHFLGSALKAAGAGLSTFGSERCTRSFLLGSRFGWHVELPSLVAGRRVLTRWLVDFLRLVFGESALIGAPSLSAFD